MPKFFCWDASNKSTGRVHNFLINFEWPGLVDLVRSMRMEQEAFNYNAHHRQIFNYVLAKSVARLGGSEC